MNALPSVSSATNDAALPDHTSDLKLGSAIREMITAKFDADTARAFTDSVIVATRPGTPERKRQDRIEKVLTARIDTLLSGEAS